MLRPTGRDARAYHLLAEVEHRIMEIVRLATHGQPGKGVFATFGKGNQVVQLEPRGLATSVTLRAQMGTAIPVAFEYRPPQWTRDVATPFAPCDTVRRVLAGWDH